MINYNYLSEDIKELFDYVNEDIADLGIGRSEIENNFLESLKNSVVVLKIIKRKSTTSISMLLNEEFGEREGEVEEAKLIFRFDEDGRYISHDFDGMTFERDFEYYLY